MKTLIMILTNAVCVAMCLLCLVSTVALAIDNDWFAIVALAWGVIFGFACCHLIEAIDETDIDDLIGVDD
jgi:ABC-type branched-subunit amino acid transport system permease subunit